MRSTVGPSRTSRPRRAKGSMRNGWIRSSSTAASAETPGENALLHVQPVLRLVPYHRMRPVDDPGGHLLAAFRRQAVHEDRVGLGLGHQPLVHPIGGEQVVAVD